MEREKGWEEKDWEGDGLGEGECTVHRVVKMKCRIKSTDDAVLTSTIRTAISIQYYLVTNRYTDTHKQTDTDCVHRPISDMLQVQVQSLEYLLSLGDTRQLE